MKSSSAAQFAGKIMLVLATLILMAVYAQPADRTPAIYRCPLKEAKDGRLPEIIESGQYDSLCIDPAPDAAVKQMVGSKFKFVAPAVIDTKANRAWRDAIIDLSNGKISPKAWLARIKPIKATIHFLSSPKTPELREATGGLSYRAVFAEALLLAWNGKPCITTADSWNTRWLPEAGALQSWILAMNDYLGPFLQYRIDKPFLVTGTPKIIRADAKPGLLIFQCGTGKQSMTYYFNNDPKNNAVLPPLNMDNATINRGLNLDGPKPVLLPFGSLIIDNSANGE